MLSTILNLELYFSSTTYQTRLPFYSPCSYRETKWIRAIFKFISTKLNATYEAGLRSRLIDADNLSFIHIVMYACKGKIHLRWLYKSLPQKKPEFFFQPTSNIQIHFRANNSKWGLQEHSFLLKRD